MRILFVTTDLMAGRTLLSLHQPLLSRGHQILVAAEGKSLDVWSENNIPVDFRGEVDPKLTELDLTEVWESVDLLVAGTSDPANLERTLALKARERAVPVVIFPDIWNGSRRLGDFEPDLILCIDSIAAKEETARLGEKRVAVVGDPALESFRKIKTSGRLKVTIQRLWASNLDERRTLLLVGHGAGYASEDLVDWVVDSILLSPDWMVVPRLLHPDPRKHDLGLKAYWEKRQKELPEGAVVELDRQEFSTDELAMALPMTVSGFSTPLRAAVVGGEMGVSVGTEKLLDALYRGTGFHRYPLARIGVTAESDRPEDLDQFHGLNYRQIRDQGALYNSSAQWDPEGACEAIESLASSS